MFSFAFFFARSRAVVSVTTFFCAHDVCLCVCVCACVFVYFNSFVCSSCVYVCECLLACVRTCVCVYVSECARARVRNVSECLISFFFCALKMHA